MSRFDKVVEQAHWLEVAAAEKLTVKALRERIRGPKAEPLEPVAKLAALIERWWQDTADDAQAYANLMAGTEEDRRPLFVALAERIAKA